MQKEYENAHRRDVITRNLQRRPDHDDLVKRNIIRDDHVAAANRRQLNALRRAVVEDHINKALATRLRPTRQELVSRGVLVEDAVDKVMSLSGDDAREILRRLALRGGLWADEVGREICEKLDDGVLDIAALESRIARRPSLEDVKERILS